MEIGIWSIAEISGGGTSTVDHRGSMSGSRRQAPGEGGTGGIFIGSTQLSGTPGRGVIFGHA